MIRPLPRQGIHREARKDTQVVDATLLAMLQQEASFYSAGQPSSPQTQSTRLVNRPLPSSTTMATTTRSAIQRAVTVLEDIFVLGRLQHRDTLVIATDYLTRYLDAPSKQDTNISQVPLIALVCFYMAVKIHEPAAVPLRSIATLYGRFFPDNTSCDDTPPLLLTVTRLEQIELDILFVLQWRLHPPTPMDFARRLLTTAASSAADNRAQGCLEQAFSADPVRFCRDYQASTLAVAALRLAGAKRTSFLITSSTSMSSKDVRRAMTFVRSSSRSLITVDATVDENTTPTFTSFTPPTTMSSSNGKIMMAHSTSGHKRCVSPTTSTMSSPSYCSILPQQPSTKRRRRNSNTLKRNSNSNWTSSSESLVSLRSPRSAALSII